MDKKILVKFRLPHNQWYEKIAVAGSFNNWKANINYLKLINDEWYAEILLNPGYYEYKFVINNNIWINDEINPRINTLDQNNSTIIVDTNGLTCFNLPFNKKIIPGIIYPDKNIVSIYEELYKLIYLKIRYGNYKNNFSKLYFDEAKDDCIYQWDSCFAELLLMFGNNLFPAMKTIDNFYKSQNKNGYIPRLLKTIDGQPTGEFKKHVPLINPPIFSYIEWKYAYLTGNISRLKHVFDKLEKYFKWIEENLICELNPDLYYNTLLGSGMDNSPRNQLNKKCGWIDMSSQQALSALSLYKISKLLNYKDKENYFFNRYMKIKNAINNFCWDEQTNYYYDIKEDKTLLLKKTAAGFWPLIASIPSSEKVDKIIPHFLNPDEFYRKNVVPTLSADEEEFSSSGWYWKGGVWSHLNYILFEGLKNYNLTYLPYILSKRNLNNILDVYYNFNPEQDKISPTEKLYSKNAFYESYSPDFTKPSTRWDNKYYCTPNFVIWTSLSLVNMFIENILGFNFNGLNNVINLKIIEADCNYRGIDNFVFKNSPIKVIYKIVKNKKIVLEYSCNKDIKLNILYKDKIYCLDLTDKMKIIEIYL